MGETQAVVPNESANSFQHRGDLTEFRRRVSEGASVHFAALAAGMEPGWERDETLRREIDVLNAKNIADAEVAAFAQIKNGKGNATTAVKFLGAKAGWNDKDDLPQEIVILPKVVDGRAEPPAIENTGIAKSAL